MILPRDYKPVAYLCSEFAIDSELPTYAGGLGVLAGDYMGACAMNHFPIVGIGLLYKGKHFSQHISSDGSEQKRDSEFDHDTSFLRPTTIKAKAIRIDIPSPSGNVVAKAYHIRLSDESLMFFLTTDVDGNPPEWRADMSTLYSGDPDSQMRQQVLLGVGGIKLMQMLSIKPCTYHFNEGRPIFAVWEIVSQLMNQKGMSFSQAWDEAKKNIVYTNHTLVAAGNPTYDVSTVSYWADPYAKNMNVDTNELIKDGIKDGKFSITDFALNVSAKHSAVSKVHGEYTKKQYPNYEWESITNGIYLYRWQDSDFRNPSLTDQELWDLHQTRKQELENTVRQRTGFGYDTNKLVISWARRLAAYKQPKAIFEDVNKIKAIISNQDRPVQILFSGNSHAADTGSKELIEEVIQLFASELKGHAIFIPNYNITLANHMVSGSDVWLNTPKGNLEACGTSGMKAVSNGVINCTVLDGWTYEVDWDGVGWTIDPNNVASDFYNLLEKEMAPMYFDRNENGLPLEWIGRMRKSINIGMSFSAKRMLEQYKKKLYGQ